MDPTLSPGGMILRPFRATIGPAQEGENLSEDYFYACFRGCPQGRRVGNPQWSGHAHTLTTPISEVEKFFLTPFALLLFPWKNTYS